jgi:DNA-directed RNA polymerase II subunit RPB11
MNAPERFLTWRWECKEDEERLTYQPDTRLPNAATFVLGKEDHTIGNLMRIQLLRDANVRFAGTPPSVSLRCAVLCYVVI